MRPQPTTKVESANAAIPSRPIILPMPNRRYACWFGTFEVDLKVLYLATTRVVGITTKRRAECERRAPCKLSQIRKLKLLLRKIL